MNRKIAVIGGDLRQVYVGRYLRKHGFDTVFYGFNSETAETVHNCRSATENASAIILGLPVTADGVHINTPCWSEKLTVSDLLNGLSADTLIFGGRIPEQFKKLCSEYNFDIYDYFEREELTVLNTIPTAEGAIEIAMRETPHTIHGSKCLVVGFGRVGKTLALMLKNLNAEVVCSARKYSDFAWINTFGLKAAKTSELKSLVNNFDIIFNTVPGKIFTSDVIENICDDALIIDLASKPGGVDFEAAKEFGKKVIWALSIPGRVAPDAAGRIIADTIVNILNE